MNDHERSSSVDGTVRVGDLTFDNPVIAASGTFGFGGELAPYYDLSVLGGICTKGLTLRPRAGNPPPRVAETASGMLNAVGLQNPGIESFLEKELPRMLSYGSRIIANIAGQELCEYSELARLLDQTEVDAVELNLSCPNVSAGCLAIGSEPHLIEEVTAACREVTDKPLWVKLTPNVTHIALCAQAAERGGADAVVLINTLLGLAVDLATERPILRNNTGGLSGPAIKPVALRMVKEVYDHTDIPIVGLGGIARAEDALEFMLCGASAVQVGTASLVDPGMIFRLPGEMAEIASQYGYSRLAEYTGRLQFWERT